jgi:hypothetical protein
VGTIRCDLGHKLEILSCLTEVTSKRDGGYRFSGRTVGICGQLTRVFTRAES